MLQNIKGPETKAKRSQSLVGLVHFNNALYTAQTCFVRGLKPNTIILISLPEAGAGMDSCLNDEKQREAS
nr:hypothetical protein Iba_chr05cCG15180 [Ipomoea batatas]